MELEDYGTIWVCTDCYFAHHYGAHEHEGQWYAGESDTPCDQEPLSDLDDFHIFDATCSEHEPVAVWVTDDDGYEEQGDPLPCPHCGKSDDENGMQEFSWSRCQGCDSHLGGSRYLLSLFKEKTDA